MIICPLFPHHPPLPTNLHPQSHLPFSHYLTLLLHQTTCLLTLLRLRFKPILWMNRLEDPPPSTLLMVNRILSTPKKRKKTTKTTKEISFSSMTLLNMRAALDLCPQSLHLVQNLVKCRSARFSLLMRPLMMANRNIKPHQRIPLRSVQCPLQQNQSLQILIKKIPLPKKLFPLLLADPPGKQLRLRENEFEPVLFFDLCLYFHFIRVLSQQCRNHLHLKPLIPIPTPPFQLQ